MSATSRLSGNLFLLAGILLFIQVAIFLSMDFILVVFATILGIFTIVGAIFAFRGTMISIYKDTGTGLLKYTGKREAAPICGCVTAPLIIVFSSLTFMILSSATEIPSLVLLTPAFLGGIVEILASIVFIRDSRIFYSRKQELKVRRERDERRTMRELGEEYNRAKAEMREISKERDRAEKEKAEKEE